MCDQPHFVESSDVVYTTDQTSTLLCPLCCGVLNQPIELACGSLVCASCCSRWIEVSGQVSCPCCYQHDLHDLTIALPSAIVYDLLGDLKVVCSTCKMTTTARQYKLHLASHCQGHYELASPSRVSARDILQRPTTAPTLPVERRVAEHLVRRLLIESESTVVKIPTRGQVHIIPCCALSEVSWFYVNPLAPESDACINKPSGNL